MENVEGMIVDSIGIKHFQNIIKVDILDYDYHKIDFINLDVVGVHDTFKLSVDLDIGIIGVDMPYPINISCEKVMQVEILVSNVSSI